MMVVGLSGGIGQGKTTVGKLLRAAAGSSSKADLEFSYPITEVINGWLAQWPSVLNPTGDPVDVANEMIPLLLPILKEKTGKDVTKEQLQVERTEASLVNAKKFLDYIKARQLAGDQATAKFPVPVTPENKYLHRGLFQWLGGTTVTQVDARIWGDVIGRRIDTLIGRGEPLITVGGVRFESDAQMIREHKGLVLRVTRPGSDNQTDVTEQARDSWKADIEIVNNGSMEDLHRVVDQLWHDMRAGWVQPKYEAVVR